MSIKVEKLSFRYGEKIIIDDLNLIVKTGENIGIIGKSGEGKTTLLKLLSGLYKAHSGCVNICGVTEALHIRNYIALVMQHTDLFPASIKENITCGHDYENNMINFACRTAQLDEWLTSLPDGIDTFVGERGSKVSGGQAQRIAIARAVLKNTPIILLDEPTSALDNDTSALLLNAMKNMMLRKTVVQVSHNLNSLINCDKIYELIGGQLYDTRA